MKVCKFDKGIRCFWVSCDFLDNFGNVRLCRHHLNPSGRSKRKEVVVLE
jgi:hypothetical protein